MLKIQMVNRVDFIRFAKLIWFNNEYFEIILSISFRIYKILNN